VKFPYPFLSRIRFRVEPVRKAPVSGRPLGRYRLHARSRARARLAKEVAGEDRISSAIRAQRSRGKKFSAEFAVDMAVELNFAPEVEC
jgi:hypothetical protein